jgi:hypothetical protein
MTAPQTPLPNSNIIAARESAGFGVTTLERSSELAAVAVAEAAKAEVEAAYKMALLSPRHEETARTKILAACRLPVFAAKARYRKPVGKKETQPGRWEMQYVIGPSIRFAEEMLRCWRNVLTQQISIYDDPMRRIARITTRDLEANMAYSKEINLEKTVERRNAKDREIVGQRVNSYNDTIYIVKATEDELIIKEAALASKVIRTNGLRLIPQHIIDEAMEEVERIIKDKAAKDPDGERKAILDGLARRGISPLDVERYVGSPAAQFDTDVLVRLREMLTSIEDGHASWQEYLDGTTAGVSEEMGSRSQPDTKGVELEKKLREVAQERGIQPAVSTATPIDKLITDEPPTQQEQLVTGGAPDEQQVILNAIQAAEDVLKGTEAGKKKYHAVLGLLKVRLSSGQQPVEVLPTEQRAFYLAQLNRAVDALRA